MKYIVTLILLLCTTLPACRKASRSTSTYMNTATITGPNLTMPVCGATYLITIHGITDSFAQFNSSPAGSGIDLSSALFPLSVSINWHHNTGSQCDTIANIVTIDALSR